MGALPLLPTSTLAGYGLRFHFPASPPAAGGDPAAVEVALADGPPPDGDGRRLLSWPGGPVFVATAGRVEVYRHAGFGGDEILWYLLGPVAAALLRLRGAFVLHASAVALAGRTVAFVGPSGSGKSTLAATLVARGATGVSDDLLVLDEDAGGWRVHPGAPRHLLWPDAAGRLGAAPAAGPHRWDKLAVGRAAEWAAGERPLPLHRLLLLRCADGGERPALRPLAAGEAAARLFANLRPEGWGDASRAAGDLARVGALVERLGAAEAVVPADLARLGEVAAAVERDAAGVRR